MTTGIERYVACTSIITRRNVVLATAVLVTPASARSFWVDRDCKGMTAWRVKVGNVSLKVPVSYRPNMEQHAEMRSGFWRRVLFGRQTYEDHSSVKYCQTQNAPWLGVEWISFSGDGLKAFRRDAGLNEQDGVSLVSLRPGLASPGWKPWRWKDGPVHGFLSDVPRNSARTGASLLSKENLLRGGQAWGLTPLRGTTERGWPTRFYIQTSDGLNVMVDSAGFTARGLDGLKDDLKVVEILLEHVVVH